MTEYSCKGFWTSWGIFKRGIGRLHEWLQTYWLNYVHEMDFMWVPPLPFRGRADRQTSNFHPFIYMPRCSSTPLYSPACRCPISHHFRFYCHSLVLAVGDPA